MLNKNKINVEKTVSRWLQNIVIDLHLCPFAQHALLSKQVRFEVSETDNTQQLLVALENELQVLADNAQIETTLLIHPNVLVDFYQYNQFLDIADALLEQTNNTGIFQIASFHPEYQFANTCEDDAENYSNRSPYPLLHILREHSVEKALDTYPDIHSIPDNNIKQLKRIGERELATRLKQCFL